MRGGIIFFLLLSVVFISSCTTQGTTNSLGGVDISFMKERPPLEGIREGRSFTVALQLRNNLLNPVEDAKLCVYDTPSDSMGGIVGTQCRTVSLSAAQELDGQITPELSDVISFPESGTYTYYNLAKGVDETYILAELQYSVDSTTKIRNVCFKKLPEIEADYPCESEEVFSNIDIESEIAPVVVEKVEKNIIPEGERNRVILTLHLRKSPYGEVISRSGEVNLLNLDIDVGGTDSSFECIPSERGMIEFDEVVEKVICESSVLLKQNYYTDAINIDLIYDYKIVHRLGPIKLTEVLIQ